DDVPGVDVRLPHVFRAARLHLVVGVAGHPAGIRGRGVVVVVLDVLRAGEGVRGRPVGDELPEDRVAHLGRGEPQEVDAGTGAVPGRPAARRRVPQAVVGHQLPGL